MVVFVFEAFPHYVFTQSLLSLFLLACIYFEFGKVPIGTFSHYPHFDPSFDRLFRHILLEGRPPLELNYSLVHCHIPSRLIHFFKLLTQVVDEEADLPYTRNHRVKQDCRYPQSVDIRRSAA